ncbi:MBL fold metallo-hydrolase [bacterium]|nr:MBL fold metallo-hydrolase [bacterium]
MNPRLRFWGVRGSFPAALPSCRQLGGNTACIEIEWQGHHLILDAGTGIRKLGERLVAQPPAKPLQLLLTHPHWDHIQGFPFFAPAYSQEMQIRVHSMRRTNKMRNLLSDQQQTAFFSVPLEQMQSELTFQEWEEGETFRPGPFEVETWRLNHPGICSGYRIRMSDYVLAYVTDVAPSTDYLLADGLPGNPSRETALKLLYENQLRLLDGAHTAIYDTFFTPVQYSQRSHWGHSTLEQAIEVCNHCNVENLFMFHHNSEIDDRQQWERVAQAPAGERLAVYPSQEGHCLELVPGKLVECA